MEQITEEERNLLFNKWVGKDKLILLNEIIDGDNYKERVVYEIAESIWENGLDLKLKLLRDTTINEQIEGD